MVCLVVYACYSGGDLIVWVACRCGLAYLVWVGLIAEVCAGLFGVIVCGYCGGGVLCVDAWLLLLVIRTCWFVVVLIVNLRGFNAYDAAVGFLFYWLVALWWL